MPYPVNWLRDRFLDIPDQWSRIVDWDDEHDHAPLLGVCVIAVLALTTLFVRANS